MSRRHSTLLPRHWTPKQALAAFELLDLLRDELWAQYGPDIQRAYRRDRTPTAIPRQSPVPPISDEPPF
jgi:hypothetical protein